MGTSWLQDIGGWYGTLRFTCHIGYGMEPGRCHDGVNGYLYLIAILFLGKYAIRLLNDYRAQKKAGIQSPVFKKETMPDIEKDLECW